MMITDKKWDNYTIETYSVDWVVMNTPEHMILVRFKVRNTEEFTFCRIVVAGLPPRVGPIHSLFATDSSKTYEEDNYQSGCKSWSLAAAERPRQLCRTCCQSSTDSHELPKLLQLPGWCALQ